MVLMVPIEEDTKSEKSTELVGSEKIIDASRWDPTTIRTSQNNVCIPRRMKSRDEMDLVDLTNPIPTSIMFLRYDNTCEDNDSANFPRHDPRKIQIRRELVYGSRWLHNYSVDEWISVGLEQEDKDRHLQNLIDRYRKSWTKNYTVDQWIAIGRNQHFHGADNNKSINNNNSIHRRGTMSDNKDNDIDDRWQDLVYRPEDLIDAQRLVLYNADSPLGSSSADEGIVYQPEDLLDTELQQESGHLINSDSSDHTRRTIHFFQNDKNLNKSVIEKWSGSMNSLLDREQEREQSDRNITTNTATAATTDVFDGLHKDFAIDGEYFHVRKFIESGGATTSMDDTDIDGTNGTTKTASSRSARSLLVNLFRGKTKRRQQRRVTEPINPSIHFESSWDIGSPSRRKVQPRRSI